jgi:hypothetical protein
MRRSAEVRRYLVILVSFFFLQLGAKAQHTNPVSYEFTNGHWYSGKDFVAKTYYSVNGVLHPNRPFTVHRQIDLQGGYVIPACGEAHNHNATSDNQSAIEHYIESGILYVKNPGNLPRVREGERINHADGIDVTFSNGLLTSPGGHPLGLVKRNIEHGAMRPEDGEGAFYFTIGSTSDLEQKWPKLLASKPDFIKVVLVYSEEFEKRQADDKYFSRRALDPKVLRPIVEKAHQAGLTVSAHIESAGDFHQAVVAGVDEINHMPGFWPSDESLAKHEFRYQIADADARQAAHKHIRVVTTLGESLDRFGSASDSPVPSLIEVYRSNIATLKRHSVPILIGSDQFRKNSRDEALSLAKNKLFTNGELLKCWCQLTPQAIFPKRRIGELKDGYEASFVVLLDNPLRSFEAVKKVGMVFKNGEPIKP